MKNRSPHWFSRIFAGSLLVGFFVFLGSVVQAASAPNVVSYQGRLLNSNGVPVSATTANIIFELYDDVSGGTCLWSNSSSTCASTTARSVTLTAGLFSENLGDTSVSYAAIPDAVFGDSGTVYLQVTIEGETLSPRKQIASAPYALNSDSLDGLDADLDGSTSAAIPAFNGNGALIITGNPSASTVGAGSLYVNPAALDTAANDTIFGIGDGGTERFRVDKEGDVFVKGIALNGVGTGPTDSGSSLIGVFDELTYSSASNIQDVLDDLDTAIGTIAGGASYWTDATTFTYLTATSEDLVLGDSTVAGGTFFFDVSTGQLALGTADTLDGSLKLFTSSALVPDPTISADSSGNLVASAVSHIFNDPSANTLVSIVDDGTTGHVLSTNGYLTAAATGLDTSAAGALTIGNTTATSVSICNSAACDTVSIGTNADADTINIGDASDTVAVTGTAISLILGGTTVSGSEITVLDGGIALSELTDSGTFTATTVDINGGAIDGTTIGASSPSTGAFTTLSSTGVTTLGNNSATVAINSSDWDINATGDATGIGALTMDGAFSQTGATTFSTGTSTVSLNGATTVANGNIFTANGGLVLGDGGDTAAINSSDWGISTTGALTNIASYAANDNQSTLVTNIGVTGTDAITHTIDFQIDGTSQLSIAADGDGAGGANTPVLTIASRVVINNDAGTNQTSLGTGSTTGTITLGGTGAQTINIGTGAAAKTVTIGSANTTSTTTIRAGSGGLNLTPTGAANINVNNNQVTNINTGTSNTLVSIGGGSGTLAIDTTVFDVTAAGLLTTSDDIAINGGDLTSTSSTFNLLDAASNSTTIEIGGVTTDLGNTVSIATNATTADTIAIGNTTATTTLALNSGTWNMASGGVLTMTATSAQTVALVVTDTDYTTALSVGDNNIAGTTFSLIGTTATINFDNFDVSSAGAVTVAGGQGIDTNGAGALALGNVNSTSVSICNSANCDSITLGTNTDADTIAIGDSSNLDTVSLNSANWQLATTGNLNSNGDIIFSGSATFGDTTGTDQIIVTSGATTGDGLRVNMNAITSGNGAIFLRGDTAGTFSGNVVDIENNESTGTGTALNVIGSAAGTILNVSNTGTGSGIYVTMSTVSNATTAPNRQGLVIDVNESTNADEVILIRSDADNNGSGVDTEFRFDNQGDAFADGSWTGSGADFAEYFLTSDSSLAAGMVACRDASLSNSVRRCVAGDAAAMGVISAAAGFVGNAGGAEDEHATDPNYRVVGLVGQIDTLASAADGAIAIGDALSASSVTTGYAGKARGPGSIIGFALEPIAAGTGTIKVLVQPQWYGGDILGRDGNALAIAGGVKLSALANATASTPAVDSNALSLVGSAWNGVSAEKVGLSLETKVNSASDYHLAIQNQAGAEVASFNQAGDLAISGKFYPSDRGVAQDSAYIYYDSSAGPGYMKTNAAGWSVGSYDFAEMFPSSDALAAGEVVTFGANPQSVARSSGTAYDNKIAGVVSTRPGFLAGDYKAGSYPIALAGRVPTKVSAENGAIAVGDPLTTSSRAGYAMKATKAGQILGYAMEPMTGGDGVITAFIRASYYAGNGTDASLPNTAISGLGTSSFASLDVTGTLNMSGGNILSIGSLEGAGGAWKITQNGDFTTRGEIVKKIASYQGDLVDAFAVTSRQVTVQLSGTTMLSSGLAEVKFEDIDPRFNDIISTNTSYRVFLTPSGITGQLSAADRSNEGFTIRDAGNSNAIAVDWLVIAYEKDHEPVAVAPDSSPVEQPVEEQDPVASDIVADNGVETPPEVPTGEVAGESDTTPPVDGDVPPVVIDPLITDPVVDPAGEPVVSDAPVDESLSTPIQSEIMPPAEAVNP